MATVEQPALPAAFEVLTLAEAAAYLRVDEETLKRLVREEGLSGRQFGNEWRFSREAILRWLNGPTPKEQILTMAGAFRDDPFLTEITEEIYQARGRSITEE